jgi:hypothetical protein
VVVPSAVFVQPAPAVPALVRQPARRHDQSILYIKPTEKAPDLGQMEESVALRLEQALDKKVAARVESTIARELSPESTYGRRLGERLLNDLYSDLVIEKERLGLR